MGDPQASIQILTSMKIMGINISIDDFGTGYSSLSYLKRIPADKVKIDRSFVSGIGTNPDDTAIVRTILSLADSMDKLVVAEGIETQEQYQTLRSMGCQAGQGYWMSKPAPPEEFTVLLQTKQTFG